MNRCSVLVIVPDRKRVAFSAKKTPLDLPIIARLEDIQMGTVTHAVVFKVLEKAILGEFYNNLRAQVPLRKAR
jgi:rRNA biogenesis protein RRP5